MPTGYTAPVADNEAMEFKDFALQCARAFCYLATMRDEPMDAEIPTEFTPSKHHIENFKTAVKDFYRFSSMRNDEAGRLAQEAYVAQLEDAVRSSSIAATTAARYGSMLAKVAKWQAPTPEHEGLRDFMISQLEQSIDFDVHSNREAPTLLSPQEFREKRVAAARWNMDYHKKEHLAEVQRTRERTGWVQSLYASLE